MVAIGRPRSCDCGDCQKCKHRDYMREWYRSQSPEKKLAIVAARDREAIKRNERKRWGTPKRRASLRAASARRYPKNLKSGRTRAMSAVAYAVKTGKLIKQPCEVCGTWLVQAHHHNGYDKEHQLDVQWLCVIHHKAVHGHLRAA